MLWPLPDLAEAPQQRGPVTVSASRVLTGHQARLWDAKFCGELIVTASEDCTCRSGAHIALLGTAGGQSTATLACVNIRCNVFHGDTVEQPRLLE